MNRHSDFHEKVQTLIDLELRESDGIPAWWYLSYADTKGFRGGLFLRAFGPVSATVRAVVEGWSPGGQVRTLGPLPKEQEHLLPPVEYRERLLDLAELKELSPLVRWNGQPIDEIQ